MSFESNTPVDPRVQIELEKLNTATDNINKYEVELDEAKCEFKRILAESVVKIKQSAHKLGNSIEAAKPYYESRIYAAQLAKETQQAAVNHEKAKSIHAAAKEMVYLAEQGLGEKSTLDTACQEMLSHAASKVNQSQLEVTETRNTLKMCQLKLEVANTRVGKLQAQLKQAIKASSLSIRRNLLLINVLAFHHLTFDKPYYETRANFNGILKAQKEKITDLENKVSDAKLTYNEALKNLEQISEEIHKQRQEKQKLIDYESMLRHMNENESSISDPTTSMKLNQNETTISSNMQNQSRTQFPCEIDSLDEYLEIPEKLSAKSSPIRQRKLDDHECPHLLHDFEAVLTFPQKLAGGMHKSASTSATGDSLFAQAQLHGPYDIKTKSTNSSSCGGSTPNTIPDASTSTGVGLSLNPNENDDIEQWTEIRLSHSDSTSSSYSNQSLSNEQLLDGNDDNLSQHSASSSSDEPKRKVTCTTIFHDQDINQINKKQSLSQWLSRSNSFKTSGRRQSLDLLIDASDKVKDVFSFSFQRVGKSLERRNSESEMSNDGISTTTTQTSTTATTASSHNNSNIIDIKRKSSSGNNSSSSSTAGDFFLFSRSEPKEILSDEQVENLLLNHIVDENGTIIVEELKAPPLHHQPLKHHEPTAFNKLSTLLF